MTFRFAGELVSGRHGLFEWRHGEWLYVDLSSNGTWHNGTRLERGAPVGPLKLGDDFSFGSPARRWRIVNVPTRPGRDSRENESSTTVALAEDLWPSLLNLQVVVGGPASNINDHVVSLVEMRLERDGRAVSQHQLTLAQSALLMLLAQAALSGEPWMERRALAEQLGYGAADPHRKVNRRQADLEKRLEKMGMRHEEAARLFERRKHGTQSLVRLRSDVTVVLGH